MDAFLHPITLIWYHRSPNVDDQILQALAELAIAVLREGPRDVARNDEFPPISDNDSSHSLIIRTAANGALDLRVRIGSIAPQLLELATVEARTAAEARALEAKSRAIRNILVPVLTVAAFAFVALRPRQ